MAAVPTEGAAIARGEGRVRADANRDPARTWKETTTGDVLTAGTTVQASETRPLEMILPDGVTVTLEPGALAIWMPAAKLPSETNRWTRGYHLVLEDGELEVRMPQGEKGAHAFLVSTKAGTLTDWRGQLHVRVQADATAASIYDGALVVGSNGQGFAVYDGAAIVLRRNVNPDKSRSIPASPAWIGDPAAFLVVRDTAAPVVDLAWQPVTHATAYRVELASDPTMVRTVERATTADGHFRPQPLAAGSYWARVRAVGEEGIVGAWSAARPIRVVHLAVPERAVIAGDGTVVVPKGETVAVTGGGPLDVAYEDAALGTGAGPSAQIPLFWSHLTGPLHLSEEAPARIVHLRDPALPPGVEDRLLLSERQLQAKVTLGPARARWPEDVVQASVEVRDPSGHIDVSGEPIALEAMLGLTPLHVDWVRTGNRWTVQIAPRRIVDPSVLRVVVKDGQGSEIGRGFLELEPVEAAGASR